MKNDEGELKRFEKFLLFVENLEKKNNVGDYVFTLTISLSKLSIYEVRIY